MYRQHLYTDEVLYIAGPECFYPHGYDLWESMGKLAEFHGFQVAMPTKNELKLDHEDLRLNADAIFRNCAEALNRTTAILADLELFRGSEPDGGTLFEMGMAYAKGARCYGFTRDKRDMIHKHQGLSFAGGVARDQAKWPLPYRDLPFCPSLIGSTKIVEGDFRACLQALMLDLEEERKDRGRSGGASRPQPAVIRPKTSRPVVYLASVDRYALDGKERYQAYRERCSVSGFDMVSPLDHVAEMPPPDCNDPVTLAAHAFEKNQRLIRGCDVMVADLGDFHGLEPSSDVAFECGMAWQLGKKCVGYLPEASIMRQRIPHQGEARDFVDPWGCVVENFDYPINLMFASSMATVEGGLEAALGMAGQ